MSTLYIALLSMILAVDRMDHKTFSVSIGPQGRWNGNPESQGPRPKQTRVELYGGSQETGTRPFSNPKPQEEGTPENIILQSCFIFLKSTVNMNLETDCWPSTNMCSTRVRGSSARDYHDYDGQCCSYCFCSHYYISPKNVKSWSKTFHNSPKGHCFTYFWGPGTYPLPRVSASRKRLDKHMKRITLVLFDSL